MNKYNKQVQQKLESLIEWLRMIHNALPELETVRKLLLR